MPRKSKFSEAQIIGAIKEIEGGATISDVARWRAKYGGMTVSEGQDKRRLEDENRRLRGLVAQFALELDAMKAGLGKNGDDLRATGTELLSRTRARAEIETCPRHLHADVFAPSPPEPKRLAGRHWETALRIGWIAIFSRGLARLLSVVREIDRRAVFGGPAILIGVTRRQASGAFVGGRSAPVLEQTRKSARAASTIRELAGAVVIPCGKARIAADEALRDDRAELADLAVGVCITDVNARGPAAYVADGCAVGTGDRRRRLRGIARWRGGHQDIRIARGRLNHERPIVSIARALTRRGSGRAAGDEEEQEGEHHFIGRTKHGDHPSRAANAMPRLFAAS
jgi:putative transposase